MATTTVAPKARKKRLAQLEKVIEKHLVGFVEVGKALLEIRDDKLYRESHPTFEAWCHERFQIGRRRAYELIAATNVREGLVRHGAQILPANERQARALSTLPAEHQPVVWQAAVKLAGQEELSERHVRMALREHNRKARVERLNEISRGNQPLKGVGRFPVLLADPPWEYDGATTDPTRQIENQYPTMPLEEICDLPVGEQVAAKDAVLFLWATAPLLPDALEVMEAWGFEYKSCAVWDKQKIGMGYWFRGQHELLLVGVRGNPPKPAPGALASSVISASRGKHSEKPEAVRTLIEAYYPELPRLEMFCRKPRKGWSAWGNQSEPPKPANPKPKKKPAPPAKVPAANEHSWVKTSLVSNKDGSDFYICHQCGCEAVRHGVNWPPARRPKFGAKKWASCPGVRPGPWRRYDPEGGGK